VTPRIYYHFTGAILRDGKPIPSIGKWLKVAGDPIPCECGFHASPDAFDALQYAPGAMLHRVHLRGIIVPHGDPVDKFAAQRWKIVASIDATDILCLYTRRVALDVIHLWKAPPVVREYLETGDESKRTTAYVAANAANAAAYATAYAANAAAYAAAYATAYAANAAANAAATAANAAATAAYAANAAAAAYAANAYAANAVNAAAANAANANAANAANAAKQKLYRGWFNEMVGAAFTM